MRVAKSFSIIILMVMMAGCAFLQEASSKQKAIAFNTTYNEQFEDYLSHFENGVVKENVSREERQILREKKQILTVIHPLLLMYSNYAETELNPNNVDMDTLEKTLIMLLAQFTEGG